MRTESITPALQSIAKLDLRSLALFRVALGLIIAVDALWRLVDVSAFYSDDGIRPRPPDLLDAFLHAPSLYLVDGSTAWASALLVVTAVVGLALAAGFWPRTMAAAAFVLVLSVQNRNLTINTGADSVLVMLCLIAAFLPLGARFSIDARRAPAAAPQEQQVATAATFVLVLQLVIIYVFSDVNKLEGNTWREGTAVLRALHIDGYATPVGIFLREHAAWIGPPLSFGTLLVEAAVLLLFVPEGQGPVTRHRDAMRTGLVVAMWGLHIGLGVCLYLALFSPVCMVAWLPMLPSSVWERGFLARLVARFPRTAPSPTGSAPVVGRTAAAFLGVVMAMQILSNTAFTAGVKLPKPLDVVITALRVGCLWRMFAPGPTLNDGWFVMPGTLAGGDVVNVFRPGVPLSSDKPPNVSDTYKNGRWRKMLMTRSQDKNGSKLRPYARWLCRDWNRTHDGPQTLKRVTITFIDEKTRRDFRPPKLESRNLLVDYVCPVEDRAENSAGGDEDDDGKD